jgi:aryl-alcohol dehydrogenase-like predicted oxidoreductase
MEYTKLGRTGLDVSRICLGCMSYGGGNRGNHAWSLDDSLIDRFGVRSRFFAGGRWIRTIGTA